MGLARIADERGGRRALAPEQPNMTGVTVVRGQGSWVEDAAGRRYLDMVAGVATLALGHGNPEVMAAAARQMWQITHSGGAVLHEPAFALADRLAELTPGRIDTFLFSATGSEANELAIRLAHAATRRDGLVCFRGGFHGRTAGALSASTSSASFRMGLRSSDVVVAPFPRPSRVTHDPDDLADIALAQLDEIHDHEVLPSETAAYLVEPVQGQGGLYPSGARFLEGLRERADRYGILLVLDEVQTGVGRTGDWFAAGRYGVEPDVISMAKALGGGFPISAVGTREDLMSALLQSGHGSTFGASPVACAAGLAQIDVIAREGLLGRVRTRGDELLERLRRVAADSPAVADARGLGYMLAVQLHRPEDARRIQEELREAGVLVLCSGTRHDVIRVIPPLNISDADLEHGFGALGDAIARLADQADDPPASLAAATDTASSLSSIRT